MELFSLEQYSALTDDRESALDEADKAAALSDVRYSGEEVFSRAEARIREAIARLNAGLGTEHELIEVDE